MEEREIFEGVVSETVASIMEELENGEFSSFEELIASASATTIVLLHRIAKDQ